MPTKDTKFDKESLDSWNQMLTELFPFGVPLYCKWGDLSDIARILDFIGHYKIANHTFFPSGGGLDLSGCHLSDLEKDCIDIDFCSIPHIVKPEILSFDSVGNEEELSYFRLELKDLDPTGICGPPLHQYEELALINGRYEDRAHFDAGIFNGEPLPPDTRVVRREWGGAILIFCKVSPYNKVPMTYNPEFAKMSRDDFHELIITTRSILSKQIQAE